MTAGVPQGSILGPTLFLVYVNDAADVLPPGAVPATYANDMRLYVLIPSVNHTATSCNTLQTGMDALAEWGTTWRIQFEPSKSQTMTITHHRHQWPIPAASFGGLNVDETATIKLLGVVFDKSMSFRNHLRSVAMRAAQRLGSLRKACRVLDISTPAHGIQRLRQTPHGVQPPCIGWRSPHHLSQLDKILRRALALISPGVSADSLALRRTVSGICFIYKLMCGPRVPCLQTLLPPWSTTDPLPRTRQQIRIANGHSLQLSSKLPPRSQNAVRRSFPYLYIPIWNSLPPSVLREPSLKQLQRFKIEAYKLLLKNNWIWATQAYP